MGFVARTFTEHLDPHCGPKRILSLDGGGVRGVLSLAILKRIESDLRVQLGANERFVLSDYFDLIGGTSTGAIIAAGLALGMTVDEIRAEYFRFGKSVFKSGRWSLGLVSQRYEAEDVRIALQEVFGDTTLERCEFRTGLAVLVKRLDTGSLWPITNNPESRYFGEGITPTTVPNRSYPLWSVVRASTAAPTYFEPEFIEIAEADPLQGLSAVRGEFIDGGVSTANNPALQLLLMATTGEFGFRWRIGRDQISLVSVGTGRASRNSGISSGKDSIPALHAVKALKSVLDDCGDLVETVLQWLSDSPTARPIDRVFGVVEGSRPGNAPSINYLRYNVYFDRFWFAQELNQTVTQEELDKLSAMDDPDCMERLEMIGAQAAAQFVKSSDLASLK